MKMFSEGFDDSTKRIYRDANKVYLGVCEWLCVQCDADGRVVEIEIDSRHVLGSLDISYALPKVEVLNTVSGGVETNENL